jgi:DNA primase
MALSAKMAKMLGKGSKADDRVSRFLDLPGYDESTEMARKEVNDEIARLKKIEKSQGLTAREEKKLDTLMNRKAREESAETEGGMARERKGKMLTEKEKKQMQESLEFRKGGAVKKKKMMGGGMAPKVYAKGGMGAASQYDVSPNMSEPKPKTKKSVSAASPVRSKLPIIGMAKGGMANCGASMKPNGPKKGK